MQTAGPGGRLLRDRRRAGARAARRDAAPVHPHARRRRLPDPDRLDRGRGHAPAGAAQRSTAAAAPPATVSSPAARRSGARGFWARLARTIMARPIRSSSRGTAVARRDGGAGLLAPGDARLDLRDPARVAVGAGVRRAAQGGRAGGVAPSQILVEARSGSVLAPATQAAVGGWSPLSRRDPEVAKVYTGSRQRRSSTRPVASSRCSSPAATTTASRRRRRSSSGSAARSSRRPVSRRRARARRRRPRAGRRLPPPRLRVLRAADRGGAASSPTSC